MPQYFDGGGGYRTACGSLIKCDTLFDHFLLTPAT